ncbi:hypothetical protein [Parashewanella tropica]|uniref:hypothetical protein n=1 Tax=Parashewanella tropica TaxID=2547970 RepID=UPI00105A5405|nr:hypothetical protein [Parashewanella tropica]
MKINNLNDAIMNFMTLPESQLFTDEILNCQIKLSDAWRSLLYRPEVETLITQLTNNQNAKYQQLGLRLSQSRSAQASVNQTAQLRIVEAEIQHWSEKKSAVTPSRSCLLVKSSQITDTSSLHSYLLNQSIASCRKRVWEQFYSRPLGLIKRWAQLKNAIAQQAGYRNVAEQQLHNNILSKSEDIAEYLDSKTKTRNIAPWNIGQKLKNAHKTKFTKIKSQELLSNAFDKLTKLGISQQKITPNLYRLWYHKRLLGHLYLQTTQAKIQSQIIRYPIIGQQFADVRLETPAMITSHRRATRLIRHIARSITVMADSPQFYLTSKAMDFSDSSSLSSIWLQKWLKQQLELEAATFGTREQIASNYQQQIEINRAKLALTIFNNNLNISLIVISSEYQNTSNVFTNYIYSTPNFFIENIGLYKELFQKDLANLIIEKSEISSRKTFEVLVVNESRRTIQQRLKMILGHSFKLNEIITTKKSALKKKRSE